MKLARWILFSMSLALSCRPTAAQTYDTNNDVAQPFVGFGIPGYVDGQGLLTQFSDPTQIVSDTAGNLYVWDNGNARIRRITPSGVVTTLAGGGSDFEGYGTNVSLGWGEVSQMAIDHGNTFGLCYPAGILAPAILSPSRRTVTSQFRTEA